MKKKISFYLSDDEYQYLLSQSESCNCSINAYIKRKVLDRTDTIKLQKESSIINDRFISLVTNDRGSENQSIIKRWR